MIFYKVVEVKHNSFGRGRMSAYDLEYKINQWANVGWVLDRIVTGETAYVLGMGSKDVFLLIFRKDVKLSEGLHLLVNNQRSDALSENELRNLIAQRRITPESPSWIPGMSDWRSLAEVAPEVARLL